MNKRFCSLVAAASFAAVTLTPQALAAQLSAEVQSVLPSTSRQVISIDYHRLAGDPVAQQLEKRVLPPSMQGLEALLSQGGIHAAADLNRLTFATFQGDKGIALLGIAEGNFGGLKLAEFFHKTPKTPAPPQVYGVSVYSADGLDFYVPDPATIVFGSRDAITRAIETQQGASAIAQNEQMTDLIAGTQSSDVWSVLDASGAQTMVKGMIGAKTGSLESSLIDKHFDGARYTIAFQDQVNINLELMTSDALSAAAVSTALNAAIALRQRQEKNAIARQLLSQIQVDSAGSHAFLQASAPESSLADLLHTDVMQTILQ